MKVGAKVCYIYTIGAYSSLHMEGNIRIRKVESLHLINTGKKSTLVCLDEMTRVWSITLQ